MTNLNNPTAAHLLYGKQAEEAADAFLRSAGYEILQKNIRFKFGEIDILAREGDDLVFVEVRARQPHALMSPIESLTYGKLCRLKRAIRAVLNQQTFTTKGLRVDVLAWEGSVWKHYKHVLHEGLF